MFVIGKLMILSFTGILIISVMAYTSPNPDPGRKETYSLFKIERNRDIDEVVYDINLDAEGRINRKNPIKIYWIKNTVGGIEENLTWVQRKFGYGLKFLKIDDSEIIFRFVSYIDREFTLKKNSYGFYKVYSLIENQVSEVQKISIKFDGGTLMSPKVRSVVLHGINTKTRELTVEIISP
jgi:hypothetical protein